VRGGKITTDYADELTLLLDEAKTMWKVGTYHENIVNLQGITAREEDGSLCRVCSYYNILETSDLFNSRPSKLCI